MAGKNLRVCFMFYLDVQGWGGSSEGRGGPGAGPQAAAWASERSPWSIL